MRPAPRALLLLLAAASSSSSSSSSSGPSAAAAFAPPVPPVAPAPLTKTTTTKSTTTALFGRAVKRGKLAQNLDPSSLKAGGKRKKKGGGGGGAKKKSGGGGGGVGAASSGVSSSLADWAASDTTAAAESTSNAASSPSAEVQVDADADADADAAASFAPFPEIDEGDVRPRRGKGKKKGGASDDRRSRQADRRAVESARRSLIRTAVSELEEALDPKDDEAKKKAKGRDLEYVLSRIRTLIANPSPDAGGMRALAQGQQMRDYRMAWAGSDEAVCHVGTGLHKVPLARLQEVFATFGKKRVEIIEVIRILGPFPNVRNTLKGDTAVGRGNDVRLDITYDSMVDGTGKEVLAGTEDNIRRVALQVLFADEEAIVCAMPAEEEGADEGKDDPLGNSGSRILLFVKEDQLDGKLDVLRVS